jgi:ABC-type transporter Mla subunit MlaD
MRRLVYICLFVAIAPWIVIGVVREATDDDTKDHYFVRAIFDNASNLVEGEDVKVAGVPVGAIESLDVTEDQKAALTLRIDNEDFTPWKTDASCTIRPQSLIGEKFVECEPGSTGAEPLATIEEGPGEGERLLPVENTSSPVDLDLVNNILRLPYRERFRILLNEFGTGLAGRGEDLNEVIHRANPALRETDRVLAILAEQNRTLARLARDSDQALGPLARERERLGHWITVANETGQASAERSPDIRRGINRLPDFLRELRPLMADLEALADQGTPLLADLEAAAPQMDRLIKGLGTLSEAGRESFPSLGDALERGRPALIRARPLIQDLGQPAGDPGHRAHQRLPLLPRPEHERVRLDGALPARGPRHQHLLDLLHRVRRRLQRELLRPVLGRGRGVGRSAQRPVRRALGRGRQRPRAGHAARGPPGRRGRPEPDAPARRGDRAAAAARGEGPVARAGRRGARARLPARG